MITILQFATDDSVHALGRTRKFQQGQITKTRAIKYLLDFSGFSVSLFVGGGWFSDPLGRFPASNRRLCFIDAPSIAGLWGVSQLKGARKLLPCSSILF